MTELARLLPAGRIEPGTVVTVQADGPECAAIAARLMVPSVQAVRCDWTLRPAAAGSVEAEGTLQAMLEQECVVSLDPFPVAVIEHFAVRFVPEGTETEDADDPDEPDQVPFTDGALDLGEATVEQLALSLDPYPRKPGAVLPDQADDGPENPFARLAKWRPEG